MRSDCRLKWDLVYSPIMLRCSFILLSTLKAVLPLTYLIGVVFGGGLHLHESLSHQHEGTHLHTHSYVAHVHNAAVFRFPALNGETISPVENEHQHPVPLVQLIAVPASTSTITKSIQHNVTCPVDLPQTGFPDLFVPILFAFPHETSPPLHSLTGFSDSGRSPPTA